MGETLLVSKLQIWHPIMFERRKLEKYFIKYHNCGLDASNVSPAEGISGLLAGVCSLVQPRHKRALERKDHSLPILIAFPTNTNYPFIESYEYDVLPPNRHRIGCHAFQSPQTFHPL